MLKCFLLFRLFFELATSDAAIQFFLSDVDQASHIYYSGRISIWEPKPPSDDFYVLGQYVNLNDERPGHDAQLIVAKSNDGSLLSPLSFHKKLRIRNDLFVWTMRCPQNYISLGAIATAVDEEPYWKKYKCVKKEATVKAELGKSIQIPGSQNLLRCIDSPPGYWKNIFFVAEFTGSNKINTTAYTLKAAPLNNVISKRNFGLDNPPLEKTKNGSTNEKVDSYITLIVSAGFVLFVIIVLTTLFCIRSRQMRNSHHNNANSSHSTGHSYLDSTLPSSGYASENETSFGNSFGFGKKTRNRVTSTSIPFITRQSSSNLNRHRVAESRNSECVIQENILYHSVTRSNFEENEYEIINDNERS